MIRRRAPLAACLLFLGCVFPARPASADIISLAQPLSGSANAGDLVGLTVSFDLNGSPASNLVGVERWVSFTGLTPMGYDVGSVFAPFAADVLESHGPCAELGCNYPFTVFPGASVLTDLARVDADVDLPSPTNSNPVPEPASLVLLGSGLAACALKMRRRPRD